MRLLLLCSALVFSLAACGENLTPVIQRVPANPKVFQGDWGGMARTSTENGPDTNNLPVRLHSTATYVDSETYHVSGTFTFRGIQYDFSGTAEGRNNVTFQPSDLPAFRAQFQPSPYPEVLIRVLLTLNGTEAGKLLVTNAPNIDATYTLQFYINSDNTNRNWIGKLNRM